MTDLPKLPGLTFSDPTISKFNKSQIHNFHNGYRVAKREFQGPGGQEVLSNSVRYITSYDPTRFDPSLTYGRTRSTALPQFTPHYVLYDQKCLTFNAFFKQSVVESPDEFYRVRQVNIIYFLEDDTLTVMEPPVNNSGLMQGKLVRRGKIPKTDQGDFWHWKDLNVGRDICIYGVVYHTVNCDIFTKEYMASQGIDMGEPEEMPPDPYTQSRTFQMQSHISKTPSADDKLRRFLEYDGKVLKFKAMWDDRDMEHGEIRKYEILYFLHDDTIAVKEVHDRNSGRDPFPLLLRKTKLPKIYTDRPVDFPAIYMELSDHEVTEYYQPKDLIVGETVYVLGRRMLLYDCDEFTRNYFRKVLCIEQKPGIPFEKKEAPPPERPMPPHNPQIGSLEDSLQNTLTFMPKPPRQDVLRQILNANKYLRYEMAFDAVHPEDTIRKFLLMYSLGHGTCEIHEPPIRNSGILGGKYLRPTLIQKPGTDPLNPDYYTPVDFFIGNTITVFEQRFKITGADLYVYRYMQANPEKFPCDVIENMRNYMFNMGYLKDDIENQVEDSCEAVKKAARDAIGMETEVPKTELQKCMEALKVGGGERFDQAYEDATRKRLVDEYEKSLEHTYVVPLHGIEPVRKVCPYPVVIGDVKSGYCPEDGDFQSYTPKHVDTPEEVEQKYYAAVLQSHKDVCEHGKEVECDEPKAIIPTIERENKPEPIMVSKVEWAPNANKKKSVKFADGVDRCVRDRYDLCDLKTKKDHCDCTDYKKK